MKTFGNKDHIEFKLERESLNNTFGTLTLEIMNNIIFTKEIGNFSFLCVDLEKFLYADNSFFTDNFFWINEGYNLLDNWKHFFSSQESLNNSEIEMFEEHFFKVYTSWKSDFFDDWIFIALKSEGIVQLKCWKKHDTKEIKNLSIPNESFLSILKEVVSYLRNEVLN